MKVNFKSSRFINRVYVVDDGSNDDTALMAMEAGAEVLRLTKNRGKGFALKYGLDQIIDKQQVGIQVKQYFMVRIKNSERINRIDVKNGYVGSLGAPLHGEKSPHRETMSIF